MQNIVSNISVDCVIFGFDFKQLNVLLVERKLEDEDFDTAAARILKEVSGLDNIYLEQFYAFGKIDRVNSPKDKLWHEHQSGFSDRIVTIGYYSLIDNTAVTLSLNKRNVKWFPINELPELGFDHQEILVKALEKLRSKLRSEPIGFELLPGKFTLSQLQKLYESILGTTYDRRNFRKKVLQMKYIIPLNEKQKDVKHKPAQLFIFSRDVYERTKRERFDFSI
jgi:8-oxo-dGTP diphosphatase